MQAPVKPSGTSKAWPYPTFFTHRGGGRHAPENTLAAMKVGRSYGFMAAEFDVKLSADGVALLMHDDTLNRTTNGHGLVADTNMEFLDTLDAGGWHSAPFVGEHVARFSGVAAYLHRNGMVANVEIKPCPGREAETGRLIAELTQALWQDRFVKPLLSSFSVEALRAARIAAPELPIGLLTERFVEADFEVLHELNAVSYHTHHSAVDAALVTRCHAAGYRVMAYTVNDVARARTLIHLGVDGIFTDELALMAEHFRNQLADTGRPMFDPVDGMELDWRAAPPPMPS